METLLNNSEAMKTVIETYFIEETVELIYNNEKLEKWNNLVAELGLTGQTQIVKPNKSPIPFAYMKTSLKNIFECLCPRKVSVREFNSTPIPLEILDLIALSERERYFSRIEIWYDEKTPDPVCIGIIEHWVLQDNNGRYVSDIKFTTKKDAVDYILVNGLEAKPYNKTWSDEIRYYLIGRWGDVKRSFDELKQMAIVRYIEEKSLEYQGYIKDYQRRLDDINNEVKRLFN